MQTDEDSTHFIFNEEKIIISPNLAPILTFLQEIEKEVEMFLGFNKRLDAIKKQHLETINFVTFLANKLKENSIDFEYKFSELPETMADKLHFSQPVRAQMIALFANLETMFCMNIAYEYKTSSHKEIISKATNHLLIDSFLGRFCVNQENDWFAKNPERLKYITSEEMRLLRNSLTHFFSVSKGLGVNAYMFVEKARELEKKTDHKFITISPEDFFEIIKGAGKLMIRKWNNDCINNINGGATNFKEKILSVVNLVTKHGAIIVDNSQLSF